MTDHIYICLLCYGDSHEYKTISEVQKHIQNWHDEGDYYEFISTNMGGIEKIETEFKKNIGKNSKISKIFL